MPTPTSLVDRIRQLRAEGEAKIAEMEQRHLARVEEAAKRRDAALARLDTKLEADATAADAEVRAFEDEINQLTNS